MMSEYEARLREAVRSLFPLEMKPIRGERNPKTSRHRSDPARVRETP
jgi:hypothetical protein